MPDFIAAVSAQPIVIGLSLAAVAAVSSSPAVAVWLEALAERRRVTRARRSFDLPVLHTAPHEAPCRVLAGRARRLWQRRDLDELSRLAARHAAQPVTMPDGARSYDTLAFAVLGPLFEAREPAALKTALEACRMSLGSRGGDAALTGLWLRALQAAAWLGRGMARRAARDAAGHWTAGQAAALALFRGRMAEIEAVLAATGHDPASSILLAEPFAHAATARDAPAAALDDRFAAVEALDPANARIWAERARLSLPGWFGSAAAVGGAMERAVGATRATHGESVLVNVTMAVQDALHPERIPGWSEPRFFAALGDLAGEPSGQVDLNHVAARLDRAGRTRLAAEVMRRHLTEIHAPAWDGEDHYLALHGSAMRRRGRAVGGAFGRRRIGLAAGQGQGFHA